MSFYGNVVNNNNKQFTFDRIYPNRQMMMDCIDNDDIFVGRFVLIDYNGRDIFKKYYKQLYRQKNNDGTEIFYFQDENNVFIKVEAKDIEENYYKKLDSGITIINPNHNKEENKYCLLINEPFYVYEDNKYYFYKYLGEEKFSLLYSSQENDDVYSINFKIDSPMTESDDRGWDSTVWQKIVYEDKEKYVMIAELNGLIPEIELCVDAPTITPQAPYFDFSPADKTYNLHVQPSWGIRIAEAKDGVSDVKVESAFTRWNEELGEIVNTTEEYSGDIYFNKAGFSVDKGYKSNKEDSISFLPTGISGYKYSNQQGDKPEADIKELSICLPSIGNAISDLWDIVYGGNSDPNNTSSYNRNTNIDWNNTSGLRLVSSSNDKYTYNTKSVNTLAGCINSVHDLMGMIIIDENVDNINLALTDYIYYVDNKYNIKNLSYNYIEIPPNIKDIHIENMINFNAENTYYQGNDNYYKADKYQFGNKYYKLDGIALVENLTSEVWKENFYYCCNKDKDNNDIYVLDTEVKPKLNCDYFKLYIENLNSIIKINNRTSIFHPTLYKSETLKNMFPTESIKNEQNEQISGSGLFYKLKNENGNEYFVPYNIDKHPDINATNATVWRYFEDYKIETSTDLKGEPIKTYEFNGAKVLKLEIIPFEIGAFYYLNEQNQAVHLNNIEDIDISKTYYKLIDANKNINSFVPIEGKFYWPGQYYYKDGNNYIYAKENNKIKEKSYYTINEIEDYPDPPEEGQSETIFYEPNKYAYIENDQWIIDTNPAMTENRPYYINVQTRYNPTTGEVLNPHISNEDYKKMGIVPCYREEIYEWKELKGFARTLNTIHGLILYINNILKIDDKFTRDLNTIQGCINQMNDIINKIESLIPGSFIIVDKYGRMNSSSYTSKQKFIHTNLGIKDEYGKYQSSKAQESESRWIGLNIDNSADSPIFNIRHTFLGEKNTETFSNKNNATCNQGLLTGINNNTDDTLKLYTPIVDNMGHVVGQNTETVMLPYSYQTFKVGDNEIQAKSTKAEIELTGNEWINVSINEDENQIIVNHNINEGQTESITVGNDTTTLEFGGSFNIPQLIVDKAGHTTEATNQSITLPQYTILDKPLTNGEELTVDEVKKALGLGTAAYTAKSEYATATQGTKADSAIQSITILGEALTNGGALTVTDAQNALGLKSAAYTESSAYATVAQGTTADSAVQSGTFAGTTFTKDGTALSISQADARAALGLGSAAYTEKSEYATTAQGKKADSALQEDTKFTYNIGDTTTTKTLKEIINDLNDRIIELEKQLSNPTIES